jgi:hypothetical protein
MIGIRSIFRLAANQSVNSGGTGTNLVDITGLQFPLAINQRVKFRAWLPCAVAGAASGLKFQATVPAGGAAYVVSAVIMNGVTNALALAAVIVAQAAVSNALANIGNHLCILEGEVINGATAGNLSIQFAQLVADAANATIIRGATLEIVVES